MGPDCFFFFQAEDGIRDVAVTGVQTCALPIFVKIEAANKSAYGNGAAIFTNSGKAAREFKHRVKAGMVGINIGVPATMAMFPFTGWGESFYGDLHIQGKEGVQFYTQQKVVSSRWFSDNVGDVWKK